MRWGGWGGWGVQRDVGEEYGWVDEWVDSGTASVAASGQMGRLGNATGPASALVGE